MQKKAIFLDLDNTIYAVSSIGDKLFKPILQLITESGEYSGNFKDIKAEIFRRPFQAIAEEFSFSEQLKSGCLILLEDLKYKENIEPFEDYKLISGYHCKKFLVTAGFAKMQYSKIKMLGIENDFDKIVVIDPGCSDLTKKEIFLEIMNEYNFKSEEVIIVGDDLNSEIKAGQELGIDTVLYVHNSEHRGIKGQAIITNFRELEQYL